jgi:hypothetical protein
VINVSFWKELGEILEHFAKVFALLTAGAWAYFGFIRDRLGRARADILLLPHIVVLPGGWLVRVHVTLHNTGTVILRSGYAELRIRQILPLPEHVGQLVLEGYDPVEDGAVVEWPLLEQREWVWPPGEFEIEPGESHTLPAEFFIPAPVALAELYFFLADPKESQKHVGWTGYLMVPLESAKGE